MASRWNLVCERAWQVTLVQVHHIVGGLVMLPFAGQLSDKVGRRSIINCCALLAMCAGVAVVYADSLVFFAVFRMFVGASTSALRVNMLVLLFEASAPPYRDRYCSLVQLGLLLGSTLATALEAGGVLDIAVITIVGIMPTSLLAFSFYWTEESPMWLLATWNLDTAKTVLLCVSQINGVTASVDAPAVEREYRLKRVEEQRALHRTSVLDMLTSQILRERVGRMMCVWFCLFFSMHFLWQQTPRHTDVWLVLAAVVPRVTALPAAHGLLERFSRKAALGVCVALSCCLTFALALVTLLASPRNKLLVTLSYELALASLGTAYSAVITHSLELFPTMLRTMAVCSVLSCGRLGAALSTVMAVSAPRFHRGLPPFLVVLSLVIAQVALANLPETKYTKLPHTEYDLEANAIKDGVIDIMQCSESVMRRSDATITEAK